MQSKSPMKKRRKSTEKHKIAISILGIVEEIKKLRKRNIDPTPLKNTIKLLINRYGLDKDLFFNGLKLIKDD